MAYRCRPEGFGIIWRKDDTRFNRGGQEGYLLRKGACKRETGNSNSAGGVPHLAKKKRGIKKGKINYGFVQRKAISGS